MAPLSYLFDMLIAAETMVAGSLGLFEHGFL
jgi:hypothetical protein